mmetsp:Transcript_22287/g.71832  ORF Transcript_22287/g.71832 Transcript_22287/m.71832 type:complete len:249 (-) Transcript_22287:80-826(-)
MRRLSQCSPPHRRRPRQLGPRATRHRRLDTGDSATSRQNPEETTTSSRRATMAAVRRRLKSTRKSCASFRRRCVSLATSVRRARGGSRSTARESSEKATSFGERGCQNAKEGVRADPAYSSDVFPANAKNGHSATLERKRREPGRRGDDATTSVRLGMVRRRRRLVDLQELTSKSSLTTVPRNAAPRSERRACRARGTGRPPGSRPPPTRSTRTPADPKPRARSRSPRGPRSRTRRHTRREVQVEGSS